MEILQQAIINRSSFEVLDAWLYTKHTNSWWSGAATNFNPKLQKISWCWSPPENPLQVADAQVVHHEAGLFLQLSNLIITAPKTESEIPPLQFLVECTPQNGQTLLTIICSGASMSLNPELVFNFCAAAHWSKCLTQLKTYLEMRNLSAAIAQ